MARRTANPETGPRILTSTRGRLGVYATTLPAIVRGVLSKAGTSLSLKTDHEVSILLCDAPTIRTLNRRWRGKDRPTDVLSFPLHDLAPGTRPPSGSLGDIVLCLPVARRRARELGIPWNRHMAHLLIHGLLHLLGYDHESPEEAPIMEAKEFRLLRAIEDDLP